MIFLNLLLKKKADFLSILLVEFMIVWDLNSRRFCVWIFKIHALNHSTNYLYFKIKKVSPKLLVIKLWLELQLKFKPKFSLKFSFFFRVDLNLEEKSFKFSNGFTKWISIKTLLLFFIKLEGICFIIQKRINPSFCNFLTNNQEKNEYFKRIFLFVFFLLEIFESNLSKYWIVILYYISLLGFEPKSIIS